MVLTPAKLRRPGESGDTLPPANLRRPDGE